MSKINVFQIKLIQGVLALCLILLILGLMDFLPLRHRLEKAKEDLAAMENSLLPFAALLKDEQTLKGTLNSLKDRRRFLESKFPFKEDQSVQMISQLAQKSNMSIVSLNIQPQSPFLDSASSQVVSDDKTCFQIPVSIELTGTYIDLIRYIKTLHESLPAFVVVEEIKISRVTTEEKKLHITLNVNIYLLT